MHKHILKAILASLVIFYIRGGISWQAEATGLPVLVGLYSSSSLDTTVGEIQTVDSWLGAPTVTFAGTFIDLEYPPELILADLNRSWDAGYVPFVNLGAGTYPWGHATPRTAAQIANGDLDTQIRNWAETYKTWSNNGEKRALIAPLQEMNGYWTSYGLDPANYKLAYYRIFQIFREAGVQHEWVGWVFAPNAWSQPGHEFENYYPGNSVVDIVGFSSFNFGSCPSVDKWETYDQIYMPYLERMTIMAPGKPIIIAEIGTVAEGGDKNAWLQDTLSKLSAYPGLRGWIYFNRSENVGSLPDCQPFADYRIYQDRNGMSYSGFKDVVTQAPYGHWEATSPEINNIMFAQPGGAFEDVWPTSAFSGLNSTWYTDWVNRLSNAGITGGCRIDTIPLTGTVEDMIFRYYCPDESVTRAQMAVFLERGIHGATYTPPTAAGTVFSDVLSSYWAVAWIEQLSRDGITGGCGEKVYCPDNIVTRAQMAVFLLKSKFGSTYTPSAATGMVFTDVPNSYWAAAWIEQLASEGITGGCGSGVYCPDSPVTRAQMAVFLVKTFNLP